MPMTRIISLRLISGIVSPGASGATCSRSLCPGSRKVAGSGACSWLCSCASLLRARQHATMPASVRLTGLMFVLTGLAGGRLVAGMGNDDLAEHSGFHVEQHVAVIGPATQRVGRHLVTQALGWLDHDRVFTSLKFARPGLQFTPHAMEVDRVGHHGVVHQSDADPLAVIEAQRLCIGELLPVE